MIGPLTTRLVEECRQTCGSLRDPRLREGMAALADRLGEPQVRVAVGGRMNAGKSTLVNALVGQRLADTGSTETTRLVTLFSYAPQDRVRVCRRDGTSAVIAAAPGGGVAAQTAFTDPESISHLVVETPNNALRSRHTIVDTPGLNTLTRLDADSLAALAGADAVIYLMPHPDERDVEAIAAVRTWTAGLRLGAANMIGVLSRIDTLAGDPDPWPAAHRVAKRYAGELRSTLFEVIPVAGLLAQAARAGEVTESDTRALRQLATADQYDLEDFLGSVDAFRGWSGAPIEAPQRERLLQLLGLYGVRVAIALIDQGRRSTGALLEGLQERSGVQSLLSHVEMVFVEGADRLRASAGIAALDDEAWCASETGDHEVLMRLRSRLDRLRLEPELRQVELASALVDIADGRLTLAEPALSRLSALASGPDDARRLGLPDGSGRDAVRAAADEQISAWRKLEGKPSRLLARHARTARELCEQMYFATG